MKLTDIRESFVSQLDKLKIVDLQRVMKAEHPSIKLEYTKFIGLKKGSDAEYYIVTKDDIEGTFIVNVMTVIHKLGEGYKLQNLTPVPEKEFEKLQDAKQNAAPVFMTGAAAIC